jgi:hypothetical protein
MMEVVYYLAALCTISIVISVDAAAPPLRTYSGTWGRIKSGFVPQKHRILLGEPLLIEFVVRNTGGGPIAFITGGDSRGSVRHNRFMIIARSGGGQDAPLDDPHGYNHGGGAEDVEELKPGETYRKSILLQDWVSMKEPLALGFKQDVAGHAAQADPVRGWELAVTAAYTLHLQEDENGASPGARVPITDGFLLTVVPDKKALKAVVDGLRKQYLSKDATSSKKALIVLDRIEHPDAVGVILEGLARRDEVGWTRRNMDQLFGVLHNHLDNDVVPNALIEYLLDPDHVGKSSSDRCDACSLLGRSQHPAAAKVLLRLAETETGAMQIQAVYGLRSVEKELAVPALRRLLKASKPTDPVYKAIIQVLHDHKVP